MRKLILSALVGAAMAWGSAASATVTVTPIDSGSLNANDTAHFGATFGNELSFTNLAFSFTLDNAMMTNGAVVTLQQIAAGQTKDIDFTSIYIDVNDAAHAFQQLTFDPNAEVWQLMPDVLLGAGEHTIYLSGTLHAPGNGSFGGDINIGGVPEPATWAMMLRIGAIGAGMRRRRSRAALALA